MDDFDSTRVLLSSIDQFSKMDPNAIEKFYKLTKSAEFMKMKLTNPNLRQKDICGRMGVSEYSITRTRKDLGIISPYRYDKPVRKARKKKEDNTDNIPSTSNTVKSSVVKTTKKKGRPKKNDTNVINYGGAPEEILTGVDDNVIDSDRIARELLSEPMT
jgi:hypothetical protein